MSRKYNGFRHMRTTQERRAGQEGWSRGKRNSKNLPNQWDDIQRRSQRSWKEYRKHQYKINENKSFKDSTKFAYHMSQRDHWFRDHRWCRGTYRRCNWCWRNDVWDDSPSKYWIRYWKEEKEKEEEDCWYGNWSFTRRHHNR